jgi:ATP-dependent DNA ligase
MLISTLLDETGPPSFNALQNFASSTQPIYFYVFDLLSSLNGRQMNIRGMPSLWG